MVGESRLLAMTSLILADKLIDNKKPIDTELITKKLQSLSIGLVRLPQE